MGIRMENNNTNNKNNRWQIIIGVILIILLIILIGLLAYILLSDSAEPESTSLPATTAPTEVVATEPEPAASIQAGVSGLSCCALVGAQRHPSRLRSQDYLAVPLPSTVQAVVDEYKLCISPRYAWDIYPICYQEVKLIKQTSRRWDKRKAYNS